MSKKPKDYPNARYEKFIVDHARQIADFLRKYSNQLADKSKEVLP